MKNVIDLQQRVEAYFEAFEAKDVDRCVEFYAPDAVVDFAFTTHSGHEAIRTWHQERFDAGLEIIELENVTVTGSEVLLHIVATSRVLKNFKINSLKGSATFQFEDDQIKSAKFAARKGFAGNMSWLFKS